MVVTADLRLGFFHSKFGVRVDETVVEHFTEITIDDLIATVDYFSAN